jgi:microcin C transport system substrate-binding protein
MKSAVLALAACLSFAAAPALADPAQNGPWISGLSLLGAPKYQPGFAHWNYVNPGAPKGGLARLDVLGGFDTFNPILPQGEPASGLGLVYETLMTGSLDDTSASYPLLAEAVAYPPDYSSVTFRMNPKAKWQDGTPVTADDVVWSFQKQMALNPSTQNYYGEVTKAAVTAPGEVTFYLSSTGNREMPVILGQLSVLPQHWWEGKDASGKQRDIGASTQEPPMGSGPYKLKSFSAGSEIVYERDPSYWAANEPSGIGENNFDELRFEYFRDPDVAFEGFKGDQFDWWDENRAKRWATAYDFPAAQQGKIVKELFPQPMADSGVMVGFVPNLRIDKFKDPRVREALLYAFDFESVNKTVFYGQYQRISSYFFGLPFASSGLPQGKELDILNTVKDQVPASVFTEPYVNPVGGDPGKDRANLRKAIDLFQQAGYHLEGNQMVDANGKPFSFELLLDGPTIEVLATPYQQSLKSIGIDMQIRSVDSAEYTNRMRTRDFEMTYQAWVQSLSPGNEQYEFFGSKSANDPNTTNYGGIANPAVDKLIDAVVHAPDRDTLVDATKALDRVLLANYYVIPSYTLRNERIARWDRFSHPDTLPDFSIGFPEIWWYDQAKADKTGKAP